MVGLSSANCVFTSWHNSQGPALLPETESVPGIWSFLFAFHSIENSWVSGEGTLFVHIYNCAFCVICQLLLCLHHHIHSHHLHCHHNHSPHLHKNGNNSGGGSGRSNGWGCFWGYLKLIISYGLRNNCYVYIFCFSCQATFSFQSFKLLLRPDELWTETVSLQRSSSSCEKTTMTTPIIVAADKDFLLVPSVNSSDGNNNLSGYTDRSLHHNTDPEHSSFWSLVEHLNVSSTCF